MFGGWPVVLALALAACGSVAGGDPPADAAPPADAEIRADAGACPMTGETGTVSATWDLQRDGESVSCEDIGATLVEIVTRPTCIGGEEIGDLLACVDLSGMTMEVAEGPFEVFLNALDNDTARIELGQSESVFIDVDPNQDTDVENLTIIVPP